MNPNSFTYFGFIAAGAAVYHILPKAWRKVYLLLLSIGFYFLCTTSFLWLLPVTILVNYGIGRWMQNAANRKLLLLLGLGMNLGALSAFKYLGFLGEIANRLLEIVGIAPLQLPAIALPIGISFYMFVSCGYLIDVYRGKREAEKNIVDYSLFVAFFPAVLSGPIERADHLLPQIKDLHRANGKDLKFAVTRLLVGLAKKVLLADTLAILVNTAYADPTQFSGIQLMFAAIAYSFQIYCDFSAYSDMAVGTARLFGIHLIENFRAPYLAASSKEFWHRWHISLSTWFRDYLYFPLGGSRKGKARAYLNVLIVFAFSGLWHGAAMKFVVWGLLCGVYQVIGGLLAPGKRKLLGSIGVKDDACWLKVLRVLITFGLTTVSWVFFRADSISQAMLILTRIATAAGACFPVSLLGMGLVEEKLWVLGIALAVFLLADSLEEFFHLRDRLLRTVWLRYALWVALLIAVAVFGAYGSGYNAQEFVYFQF